MESKNNNYLTGLIFSREEQMNFLQAIRDQIPEFDKFGILYRLNRIKYDEIAKAIHKSVDETKYIINLLVKHKFPSNSMAVKIKEIECFWNKNIKALQPPKPPNVLNVFIKDKHWLIKKSCEEQTGEKKSFSSVASKLYKKLSIAEKEKYCEMYRILRLEYEEKIAQYKETHPEIFTAKKGIGTKMSKKITKHVSGKVTTDKVAVIKKLNNDKSKKIPDKSSSLNSMSESSILSNNDGNSNCFVKAKKSKSPVNAIKSEFDENLNRHLSSLRMCRPPSTLKKFYVSKRRSANVGKAKRKWLKLSAAKKEIIKAEYKQLNDEYILTLRQYFKTLAPQHKRNAVEWLNSQNSENESDSDFS